MADPFTIERAGDPTVWSLRINRIAVGIAVHLAIARPFFDAIVSLWSGTPLGANRPDMMVWSALLCAILVADLAMWPALHRLAHQRNWILGPGGRAPTPRENRWWRYWPYA